MSLDCQLVREELLELSCGCSHWVQLDLSPEQQAHLRTCSPCREVVQQQLKVETSLHQLKHTPLPGLDLRSAIMARIAQRPATLPAWLSFAPWLLGLAFFLPTPAGLPKWAWPPLSLSWPLPSLGLSGEWADGALLLALLLLLLSTYRWRSFTLARS